MFNFFFVLTLNPCELTACLRLRLPTGHMIFLKSPKITAFLDSDSIGQGQLLFLALHESGFGELTTVSPLSVTFQRSQKHSHQHNQRYSQQKISLYADNIWLFPQNHKSSLQEIQLSVPALESIKLHNKLEQVHCTVWQAQGLLPLLERLSTCVSTSHPGCHGLSYTPQTKTNIV